MKRLVKPVAILALLALLGVLLVRSASSTRAEAYTISGAALEGWTLTLNPDRGDTGTLLALQAPDGFNHALFNQVFLRAMESFSSPTVAFLPVVLKDEFDNALAGNLFYSQDDAWIASSAPGVGLKITIWLNGKVRVGGGRIYNHVSDAVLIADNTIDFRDTDDSIIETNGGYGINASVAVAIRSSGTLQNNSAGNYHVNVTPTDSNGFSSRTLDFYAEGT